MDTSEELLLHDTGDDVLTFIPAEEQPVYDHIQTAFKSLLLLKKSNEPFTLAELQRVQEDLQAACLELLTVRREFKRLRSVSSSDTEIINLLYGRKGGSGLDSNDVDVGMTIATVIGNIVTVQTPADILLRQAFSLLKQLLGPLFEKMSPALFPLFRKIEDVRYHLDTFLRCGAYSLDVDIIPLQQKLRLLESAHVVDGKFMPASSVARSTDDTVHQGQAILSTKLHSCYRLTRQLVSQLDNISPSLAPMHEKLVGIHKSLVSIHSKAEMDSYSIEQINSFQNDLRAMDALRHGHGDAAAGPGSFLASDSSIPSGQAIIIEILESCFQLCHALLAQKDRVIGQLRPTYEHLIKLRRRLRHLFADRLIWSVDGRISKINLEVLDIQEELRTVDAKRVKGRFASSDGSQYDSISGQDILHMLLHRSFRLVHKLLLHISSIDPTLCTSHNPNEDLKVGGSEHDASHRELLTIRRMVLELRKHSPWTPDDLKPLKVRLYTIGLKCQVPPLSARTPKEETGYVDALFHECQGMISEMEIVIERQDISVSENRDEVVAVSAELNRDESRLNQYRPMPVSDFSATPSNHRDFFDSQN